MASEPIPRSTDELLAALPSPWPREDVLVPNGTLSVRQAPALDPATAEPALFVHGLGGNATNWTDLMALLRDRVDGVAVDLPGFGWSPPPRDGDFSLRRSADSLADLVEQRFDGRPVHLFGNSMGGAITVQLAARRPHLVRTLTLVSPALPKVGVRRTNVHLPVIAAPGLGTTLMKRYLTLEADTRAKATIDICFADPSSVPVERMNEAVQEVRRRDALPYTGDVFVQSLRSLLSTYLDRSDERPWKLAERIAVPTLLVYGRADKLVDPIHAHTKAFPDVRVLVLPHAGHVSQIEQPVLVADAWRDLLRAGATR
jgi:pimeloyl-ACP methyl ester carboxylesterase